MRSCSSTPNVPPFFFKSANGKVKISGTRIKVDKVPLELQKLVFKYLKENFCFIVQHNGIIIQGCSDVEVRAASARILTIETFSKPEFFFIVERWGTIFAFICNPDNVADVKAHSKVLPENQPHPLRNYIKRISSDNSDQDEDDDDGNEQEQHDVVEDDDFMLMFSSRKIPFVGSFVESHFKVPIHV